MKTTLMLVLGLFSGIASHAGHPNSKTKDAEKLKATTSLPYLILENKGQVINEDKTPNAVVKFYCETGQAGIFFRENQVSYVMYKHTASSELKRERIDLEFEGANEHPQIIVSGQSSSRFNFYGPENKYGSKEDVVGYSKLTYVNLYPNIDLVYTVKERQLKYDFVIHPGGDYRQVKMKANGAKKVTASKKSATIETTLGSIQENIPHSYFLDAHGKQTPVEITYASNGDELSFESPVIKPSQTLVIDPTLVFFTDFSPSLDGSGGNAISKGKSVAVDAITDGFVIVGETNSTLFPVTVGPYGGPSVSTRAFIILFDAAGNMVWNTTVESNNQTSFEDVYWESSTHSLFAGGIAYGGLPSVLFSVYRGNSDGFISGFEPSTGALRMNYYIGGNGYDGITCLAGCYQPGRTFAGGFSSSMHLNSIDSFLTHPNMEEMPARGSMDGFVVNFEYSYTGVSTPPTFIPQAYAFIGSNMDDQVTDIDYKLDETVSMADGFNKLFVTGTTQGDITTFYPLINSTTTLSPNTTSLDQEVFVLSMGARFATLYTGPFLPFFNGTFLGQDGYDEFNPRIDVTNDRSAMNTAPLSYDSNVYVSFTTYSAGLNSLVTAGAYQSSISGSGYDNFAIALHYKLQSRSYASFFGPATTDPYSGDRLPFGVKADERGAMYLFGTTANSGFTSVNNIIPGKTNPGTPASNQIDAFIIKLNMDHTTNYASLIGTSVNEYANEIALNPCGTAIYMTGAHYTAPGGTNPIYAFKCKIDQSVPLDLVSSAGTNLPSTLSFTNPMGYFTSMKINWYYNGQLIQNPNGPTSLSLPGNLPGLYNVEIVGGDYNNQCVYKSDSITLAVNCNPSTNLSTVINGLPTQTITGGTYLLNSVVSIAAGKTLTLQNVVIVATPCSRIEIQPTGQLVILNSVLTSCTNWGGIYKLIDNTTTAAHATVITNSGISNAIIGYYGDYSTPSTGANTLRISGATFYNNTTHVGLYSAATVSINASIDHSNFLKRMGVVACSTYTAYNSRIKNSLITVNYDSYIYMKGFSASSLTIKDYNQFTGYTGQSSVAIRGVGLDNAEFDLNTYSGEFNRCISIDQAKNMNIHDETINSNNTYGIYLNATGDNNVIKKCSLSMASLPASKAIGISMFDCTLGNAEQNYVNNYTTGIEFFFDITTGTYATAANMQSYIQKNSIYNAFAGIVVAYKADPYNNSSGINSGFSHKIPVWMKCNGLHGCTNGILGSGKLIDQYKKIPPTGTSTTDEEDPGNTFYNFGTSNWDIIWGNGGVSGYTCFSDPSTAPNNTVGLTKTAVSIDGTNRGATPLTNNFTIQTVYTGTAINIAAASCYGFYKKGSTGLFTPDPAKTADGLSITVYPNPTTGLFSIPLDGLTGASKVEVMDILGKTVYSGSVNDTDSEIRINGSSWNTGLYIIRLYKANDVIGVAKLIKSN